jgi:hypothetical protein
MWAAPRTTRRRASPITAPGADDRFVMVTDNDGGHWDFEPALSARELHEIRPSSWSGPRAATPAGAKVPAQARLAVVLSPSVRCAALAGFVAEAHRTLRASRTPSRRLRTVPCPCGDPSSPTSPSGIVAHEPLSPKPERPCRRQPVNPVAVGPARRAGRCRPMAASRPSASGHSRADKQQPRPGRISLTWAFAVERVTGIEPALSAWEADVLPLNYTRKRPYCTRSPGVVAGPPRRTAPTGLRTGNR